MADVLKPVHSNNDGQRKVFRGVRQDFDDTLKAPG